MRLWRNRLGASVFAGPALTQRPQLCITQSPQQHANLEGELARLPTARQLVTRAQELETSLT